MPSLISAEVIAVRVAQLKRIAHLPDYEHVLEILAQNVYSENIQIDFWAEPRSKLRYSTNNVGKPYAFWMILKEKPILESRKDMIYDIMHEMGHYWDDEDRPKPMEQQSRKIQRKREERAWVYADTQFITFPELQSAREEYEAYKQYCLGTYPIA